MSLSRLSLCFKTIQINKCDQRWREGRSGGVGIDPHTIEEEELYYSHRGDFFNGTFSDIVKGQSGELIKIDELTCHHNQSTDDFQDV